MKAPAKKKRFGPSQGHALLVAILFSGVMFTGVMSFLGIVSGEISQQSKRVDRNRALEVADAGLEHALWQINDDLDWWEDVCEDYEEGEQTDEAELISSEGLFGEGERYVVDIDHLADSQSGRPCFFIRGTGYVERDVAGRGTVTTIKTMAVMTRPEGFSDFYRFVANGSLGYAPGAILDGKVHTNGDLYVNGTIERPIIFRRRVSVGGTVNGYSEGTTFFYDELETGADQVPLPDTTAQYAALAQEAGIYYDPAGDHENINLSTMTYPPGFNGIVYCTKDIKIHGTPTRPVTFVSADDIFVTDHIHQAADQRHVIGLIAKDYIYLDEDTPDDLQVNAALMAIDNTWQALGGGSKYGLTIRGSIVTNRGGSAGPYLAGARHYTYDRRMLFYQPPHFPDFPGGSYVLTAWLESAGEREWFDSGLEVPDMVGAD